MARTGARTQISATAKTHANTIHRLQADRSPLARQALQQLQRQYGNRYVQRVVELARQGEGHTEVAPEIEAAIERQRGGGQALDNGVRGQMESAFGVDFSRVNIHADNASDLLNRSLEARAFTVGSDIFFRVHTDAKAAKSAAEMNAEVYTVKHNIVFATGRYAPDTQPGRQLLAHELTHSLQQSETHFQVQRQKGGGSSTPARSSSRPLHIGEYVIVPDPKNRPSEWAPLSGYSEVRGGEILDVWFDGSNYFFYVENHGNKLKYCLPSNWFRSTRLKKAKYCGPTCPPEVIVSCFDSSFGMNLPAPRGWDRKNLTKAKKQCLEFLERSHAIPACIECLHNQCSNTNFDLTKDAKYACTFRLNDMCEELVELASILELPVQQKKPKRRKKRKRQQRDWEVRRPDRSP